METTGRHADTSFTNDLDPMPDGQTAVAAVFPDRDSAHEAVHQLHHDGFHRTWIGVARRETSDSYVVDSGISHTEPVMRTPADPVISPIPPAYSAGGRGDMMTPDDELASGDDSTTRVESDNWFMRFFGEGDESLYEALIRHGVDDQDARGAGSLPAHGAIVTVNGDNHPELAAEILSQCGGRVITSGFGATGYGTAGRYQTSASVPSYGSGLGVNAGDAARADAPLTDATRYRTSPSERARLDASRPASLDGNTAAADMSDAPDVRTANDDAAAYDVATAYDDYGRYRAGNPVDEGTRVQLREERLRIDKQRISRGEATVGTDIVTESHDIDVPLMREELFIERRPARASTPVSDTPLGGDEAVSIPLTEERVTVTKVPVVTEEIVVGKREVQDAERISETTRREQRNVADALTSSTRENRDQPS